MLEYILGGIAVIVGVYFLAYLYTRRVVKRSFQDDADRYGIPVKAMADMYEVYCGVPGYRNGAPASREHFKREYFPQLWANMQEADRDRLRRKAR